MTFIEIILLAIGLSMDSLAVSVTGGAVIRDCTRRNIMKIALVMGGFQAGMTVIGYLIGKTFASYIEAFDHWIAFLLLLYLGGSMIYNSFATDEEDKKINPLENKTLMALGIATSIDALAIGLSFAVLQKTIVSPACIIGLVTFAFSGFGVYFGNKFGKMINIKLDLIGGIILIAIGTKILLEHTFLNPLSPLYIQ
ncbi:MAG: manganese efflux pump MntP family protein [Tannerellaceae bacterium]|nr:manganese efflux pump MntP family protein [Tannerellaceae bacterium]